MKITEEEAELLYARADSPPELDEEESETVSLVEERVEPQKKEVIEEATIVRASQRTQANGCFSDSRGISLRKETSYRTDTYSLLDKILKSILRRQIPFLIGGTITGEL